MSDKIFLQIGRLGEVSIKVNKSNYIQVHSQKREVSQYDCLNIKSFHSQSLPRIVLTKVFPQKKLQKKKFP